MPSITKFYLHDVTSSIVGLPGTASLSAVTPTQSSTGKSVNRLMDEKIGTLQTTAVLTTSASLSAQTGWFRRFVSQQLAAQTLALGTWTLQLGALESSASANMLVFFRVYVYRPGTGATVATLFTASANSAEPGTTQTNISVTGSQAGTQAILAGDIIVVEVWSNSTESVATAFTETVAYDGTVEGSLTTNAAFVTAPAAITLLSYVQTRDTDIATRLVAVPSRVVGKQRRGVGSWLMGPVLVTVPVPPTQQQMTVAVRCVAVRTRVETPRRAPHSELAPVPFAVAFAAPPVQTLVAVTLQAVARRIKNANRQPHWELSPPTVLAIPPPLAPVLVWDVALRDRVDRQRRPTTSFLAPPTVLRTFAGPEVTVTRTRPRPTDRQLRPATVLLVPSVVLAQATIRVDLATIPNRLRGPRGPNSTLTPPTVLQTFAGEAVQDRISTTLAAQPRRHAARSTLNEPTALQTFAGPVVALARIRPRRVHAELAPPPVVRVPAVEQQEQTIRVALVRARPRPTRHLLAPPTALQTFAGPQVTLAVGSRLARLPRGPRSRLAPPTVILPLPSQAQQTDEVTLVAVRTRRELPHHSGRNRLAPPTVVLAFPNQAQQTLGVKLAGRTRLEAGRRAPHAFLHRPTVVLPLPTQQMETISVRTALRPRVEASRRAPHYRLGAPTTLATFAAEAVEDRATVVLAPSARRRYRSVLAPPRVVAAQPSPRAQTILVQLAGRTRLELPRRAPHYLLRPPTVLQTFPAAHVEDVIAVVLAPAAAQRRRYRHFFVPPPLATPPTLAQQTIAVATAWKPRLDDLRRGPHSRLAPPVVVGAPVPPPTGATGHGGGGLPPRWAERLLAQLAEGDADALADEEIALLLLLGYL